MCANQFLTRDSDLLITCVHRILRDVFGLWSTLNGKNLMLVCLVCCMYHGKIL
ncbi:unnamed protein product [Arabidopsis thaliana]|uniref:Uncharacterized protein n=1 Tax=Arabidopsis thaliana TaxID=3702 RepID=A0A654FEU3_ARATH|nr:unnamed protein product [Arabidopsis thaliana]